MKVFVEEGIDFLLCKYFEHIEEIEWAIEEWLPPPPPSLFLLRPSSSSISSFHSFSSSSFPLSPPSLLLLRLLFPLFLLLLLTPSLGLPWARGGHARGFAAECAVRMARAGAHAPPPDAFHNHPTPPSRPAGPNHTMHQSPDQSSASLLFRSCSIPESLAASWGHKDPDQLPQARHRHHLAGLPALLL